MSVQAHIVGSGELPRSTETLLRNNFKFVQYHGYLPNDLLQVLYSSVKVRPALSKLCTFGWMLWVCPSIHGQSGGGRASLGAPMSNVQPAVGRAS